MLQALSVLAVLLLSSSCSWMQDYGHCTAVLECDSCEDLSLSVEWVKDKDEKAVENPGL